MKNYIGGALLAGAGWLGGYAHSEYNHNHGEAVRIQQEQEAKENALRAAEEKFDGVKKVCLKKVDEQMQAAGLAHLSNEQDSKVTETRAARLEACLNEGRTAGNYCRVEVKDDLERYPQKTIYLPGTPAQCTTWDLENKHVFSYVGDDMNAQIGTAIEDDEMDLLLNDSTLDLSWRRELTAKKTIEKGMRSKGNDLECFEDGEKWFCGEETDPMALKSIVKTPSTPTANSEEKPQQEGLDEK